MSLRQAAEMALECLDYHWDNPDGDLEDTPYVLEAKKALRQALAESANSTTDFVEPKTTIQTEQEPVAWITDDGFYELEPEGIDAVPLYTAPPKREWVKLVKGARVEEDKVIIKTKNNDAARELCSALVKEKNGG